MTHDFQTITLGHYPQGADGAIQPIRWLILEQKEDHMLLLAEKILDMQPYHRGANTVERWEDCDLHRWLQEVFFQQAFTTEEQQLIYRNPDADDPSWVSCCDLLKLDLKTETMLDPVFLPGTHDIEQYFPTDNSPFFPGSSAEASDYVCRQYDVDTMGDYSYWLRQPMKDHPCAYIVSPCDSIGAAMLRESVLHGVRPAMWLKTDAC